MSIHLEALNCNKIPNPNLESIYSSLHSEAFQGLMTAVFAAMCMYYTRGTCSIDAKYFNPSPLQSFLRSESLLYDMA